MPLNLRLRETTSVRLTRNIDNEQLLLAKEDMNLAKEIWALMPRYPRRADLLNTMGHAIQALATEHWNAAYRPVPKDLV